MCAGGMVYRFGLMEPNTKVNGKTARLMVKVVLLIYRKIHTC